jgi:GNAT superfamily N-acetyltransferase
MTDADGDGPGELRLLGWPPEAPRLRLDHRRFAYAGKFVVAATGKAVVADGPLSIPDPREGYASGVLAAVAFSEDRTDPETLWLRYVTVREDRRGEGLGPRLCAFACARGHERGYDRFRIAVNNPYAYEALYRAGFGFTGRETGLAELVLERPAPDRSPERYRAGLSRFRDPDRSLPPEQRAFLEGRTDPPETRG